MEVSTVSPSPASPTEGDDLCETDVTSVAIHTVTLLFCLCGLFGNGAVIGLLNLKSHTSSFCDLAVIDSLYLLFAVPTALLFLVEDVSCSPILPLLYLNFLFHLSVVSYYWGLFWLMRSSDPWYIYMPYWFCCCFDLPERLVWVVDSVQSWAFFAVFAVTPAVTFLCPSHEQEHCRAALISMNTIMLLLFVVPVVISGTVDFIKFKRASLQQQPQRRDIVIIVIVLFTLLLNIWKFLQDFAYLTVPSQVVFLLACIHSSIKPFIYFLVAGCRRPCSMGSLRLSLQRVFEEQKKKPTRRNDATRDMEL